jgi:plasmid stabilization system protein ParE
MRIVYSPRAIRDLDQISAYYRAVADSKIAAAIAERIEYVINRATHTARRGSPVALARRPWNEDAE